MCASWPINTGSFPGVCDHVCDRAIASQLCVAPGGPPPAVVIHELLDRLAGTRTSGGAGWRARCPGHDDWDASLSIRPDDDGRRPLACRSGCAFDAIVAAVGLEANGSSVRPSGPRAPGVVLLTCEDDLSDRVRPRLDAAGTAAARIVHLTHVGDEPSDPRPRPRHRRGHRGDRRQAGRARPVHGLWPSRPTAARTGRPSPRRRTCRAASSAAAGSSSARRKHEPRAAGTRTHHPGAPSQRQLPTRPATWAAPRSLLESTSDGNGPADAKVVPGEKPYRGWPPSLSIRVRSTVSSVLPRHLTLRRSTIHNSNPGRRR